MPTLIIFWQFILKVIEELSVVSNPILSLEMLVVRLVHLKEMPSYEDVLDTLNARNLEQMGRNNNTIIESNNKTENINDENQIKTSKEQIKNTIQTKPILSSLDSKNLKTNETIIKVSSFENLVYFYL